MFSVWNTKHPDVVMEIVKHANWVRYGAENEHVREESIVMTDQWANELQDMPFTSKQKGRMSALLKAKSKINVERKPRVTYEAYDFSKRMRKETG